MGPSPIAPADGLDWHFAADGGRPHVSANDDPTRGRVAWIPRDAPETRYVPNRAGLYDPNLK